MAQNSVDVGAAVPPSAAGFDPFIWKTSACAVLGLAGMYYLMAGKRDKDFKSMILGCALIFLAALVF
jgi:hypothetical protein